jgi:hypothetical protein
MVTKEQKHHHTSYIRSLAESDTRSSVVTDAGHMTVNCPVIDFLHPRHLLSNFSDFSNKSGIFVSFETVAADLFSVFSLHRCC